MNPHAGAASGESEQAEFYAHMEAGYEAAARATGEVLRPFRVAGTAVRLRFAGSALLATIARGLAFPLSPDHQFAPGTDVCDICLWDSASTGISLPPPPRRREDLTGRGNIWGFDSSRFHSAYHWGEGSVSVMDSERRRAVFWVPSGTHLPAWVLSSPLRTILHWWLRRNGRHLLHAAAIGHQGRGILLPGRGGSGKSSTSLACLTAGLDFLSDDYVAVALDPEPRIYHLYSTAKVTPEDLRLFPDVASRCNAAFEPGFEKSVLFLREDHGGDGFASQVRESLPLSMVLKPSITGLPDTTIGPVEPWVIENELASDTLAHLPHAGEHAAHFLRRIACEIPAVTLLLGTNRQQIPAAIRQQATTDPAPPPAEPAPSLPWLSLVLLVRNTSSAEAVHRLAQSIDREAYRRLELLVLGYGSLAETERHLRSTPLGRWAAMQFLPFDAPVPDAIAWNRGIREAFAEFILFLEPEDELKPGALAQLAQAALRRPEAGVFTPGLEFSRPQDAAVRPLTGRLVRKELFRRFGLLDPNHLTPGRSAALWLDETRSHGTEPRHVSEALIHVHAADSPPSGPLSASERLRLFRQHRDLARTRP